VAFLADRQRPSGEIPVFTVKRRDMVGELEPDPSVFPTALAVQALRFIPGAADIRRRGLDFLLAQRTEPGVWRHWTRAHPYFNVLPPDLDDTSCASAALTAGGSEGAADRQLLLANRNGAGLFYTWIVPRLRPTSGKHGAVVRSQLSKLPVLYAFFRSTAAKWNDVDAVVNANCLHALGSFPGRERVVEHLLSVLRAGGETSCDKWYDNPFVVWYFFSRALSSAAPEADDLILRRLATATPKSSLELALAAASNLHWGRVPDETTASQLLNQQLASGGWPHAALYHGGRALRRDGTFEEPHPDTPYWGSEELTTAFCLEVLGQVAKSEGAA
jgi:SAM-dependent methyltransferase